jgi:hypothetical protein
MRARFFRWGRGALLASWALVVGFAHAEQPPSEAASAGEAPLEVPLARFQSLVESRLEGTGELLRLLAASPEVRSGQWAKVSSRLRALEELRPEASAIWFARPDGAYWTLAQGATGHSLRDRPYFPRLLGGSGVAGALVISRSSGARSIIVAEPVREAGKLVGALGVSLSAEKLSRWVEERLGLTEGLVFYGLDPNGQTAVHRDPSLMFEYPSDIGSPSLRAAVRQMQAAPSGVVRCEFRGVSKSVQFARSASLGWVFAVGRNEPPRERGVGGAGEN